MKRTLFIPGIIWLIISIILLSLPGDDLPHNSLFDIPNFDKLVHFGMFSALTLLFCIPYIFSRKAVVVVKKYFIVIAILVLAYGIAMEYVQKYFVVGRSFDFNDIVVDGVGSLAGLITGWVYYGKKIGPDGNQGRNQN